MKMSWSHEQTNRVIEDIKRDMALLKESTVGWTNVDLPNGYKDRYHAIDVEIWADENCGDFKKFGRTFYFKDEKDAAHFLLRWS